MIKCWALHGPAAWVIMNRVVGSSDGDHNIVSLFVYGSSMSMSIKGGPMISVWGVIYIYKMKLDQLLIINRRLQLVF